MTRRPLREFRCRKCAPCGLDQPCSPTGDDAVDFYRKKRVYELLVADLDQVIEAYGDDSPHVHAFVGLLDHMSLPPMRPKHAALENRPAPVYSTASELLRATMAAIPVDGDLAYVEESNVYYSYSRQDRTWYALNSASRPEDHLQAPKPQPLPRSTPPTRRSRPSLRRGAASA